MEASLKDLGIEQTAQVVEQNFVYQNAEAADIDKAKVELARNRYPSSNIRDILETAQRRIADPQGLPFIAGDDILRITGHGGQRARQTLVAAFNNSPTIKGVGLQLAEDSQNGRWILQKKVLAPVFAQIPAPIPEEISIPDGLKEHLENVLQNLSDKDKEHEPNKERILAIQTILKNIEEGKGPILTQEDLTAITGCVTARNIEFAVRDSMNICKIFVLNGLRLRPSDKESQIYVIELKEGFVAQSREKNIVAEKPNIEAQSDSNPEPQIQLKPKRLEPKDVVKVKAQHDRDRGESAIIRKIFSAFLSISRSTTTLSIKDFRRIFGGDFNISREMALVNRTSLFKHLGIMIAWDNELQGYVLARAEGSKTEDQSSVIVEVETLSAGKRAETKKRLMAMEARIDEQQRTIELFEAIFADGRKRIMETAPDCMWRSRRLLQKT